MHSRLILITVLCLGFARSADSAQKLPFDPSIAAASAISPATIMQEDLKAHVFSVHPTIGLFTYSSELDDGGSTANGSGLGGSIEATYSVSDHIGWGMTALGYDGSGSYSPGTSGSLGLQTGSSGTSSVKGFAIGLFVVFDPFSGEGFRLPFFFGMTQEQLSSSMPNAFITGTTLNSPAYMVGFSPRFSMGAFRIEPFALVTAPLKTAQITCEGGQTCASIPLSTLPVFGVNIVYKPWNLAFFLSASSLVIDTGASYYSIGQSFKF